MLKLTEGLYRVESTGFSNGYLIEADVRSYLVDTGPPGRSQTILKEIQEGTSPPRKLTHIVLTHFHHDHVGNASEISSATGAQVFIHEADADVVKGKASVPAGAGALGHLLRPIVNFAFKFPPVHNLRFLRPESEDFYPWQVIHASGHTPGSICLFHPGRKILICGDAINHRGGKLTPPPSLFTIDPHKAWDSLAQLSSLEFTMLLPGHGPPILTHANDRVRAILHLRKTDTSHPSP